MARNLAFVNPILQVVRQVIKKKNNVILEEISGFYYLSAFWKLTNFKKEAHFIAATGVGNVRVMAQMFLGWGLGFAIAVDDDSHGRQVYNELKRDLYKNDDALAQKRMLKKKYGTGIEDIFTPSDFKKLVLLDDLAMLKDSNSQHMKSDGLSKPIVALQFLLSVNDGKIKLEQFEKETASRIQELVSNISDRLN